jgi:hypothetical protein
LRAKTDHNAKRGRVRCTEKMDRDGSLTQMSSGGLAAPDVSSGTVVFRSFTLFRTFHSLLSEKTVQPARVQRPVNGRG